MHEVTGNGPKVDPTQDFFYDQRAEIHHGYRLQGAAKSTDSGSHTAHHYDVIHAKASLLELGIRLL
jgi:hypothetical protein